VPVLHLRGAGPAQGDPPAVVAIHHPRSRVCSVSPGNSRGGRYPVPPYREAFAAATPAAGSSRMSASNHPP
jgi:hypothetical protein